MRAVRGLTILAVALLLVMALPASADEAPDEEPTPLTLLASTLLGGSYHDQAVDMATDADGNVYLLGTTISVDYPVTSGAFSEDYSGDDVIVTKMDPGCSKVIWSTFLGGTGEDVPNAIDVDGDGNVYVVGTTKSSDFPVTVDAMQTTIGNQYTTDMFITKISADGSKLLYSTFLGGYWDEVPGDIAVQGGKVYVVGRTDSTDFPLGAIASGSYTGSVFLVVMDDGMTTIETFSHWGGSRSDQPEAVLVDDEGVVTIGGATSSWDFPTTPGSYMNESSYGYRSFVLRYDPSTNDTLFSTYFGFNYAVITDMAVDDAGDIYLTGWAMNLSNGNSVPVTDGAFQTLHDGRTDAFITKMDGNGTHLIYSTLVGGAGDDTPVDIEVTGDGRAVLVGSTRDGTRYPISPDGLDDVSEGVYEGYLFVLSEDGSEMEYSTFVGGQFADQVAAVEISTDDTLLLAGHTESKDLPTTEGAYQRGIAGDYDLFAIDLACLYPPSAPRGLTATGGETSIRLDWSPPVYDAGYAVTHYQVWRGDAEDGLERYMVTGNVTTFMDEDVEYGDLHFYALQAFNGRGISPLTKVVSAMRVTVPDPPINLTGMVNDDSIHLMWDPPEFNGGLPLTEYRLYRAADNGTMSLHATLMPIFWAYVDLDILDRTMYTYQLATVNEYGESRERATIVLRSTAVPTPPLNLTYTYGDLFILLAWEPPEDDGGRTLTRYNVYRYEEAGERQLVGSVAAPNPGFRDRLVDVGVTYRYVVTVQNVRGESDPSNMVEAMAMVRPGPPVEVAASAQDDHVRVTWSPPTNDGASPVTGYRVYLGDSLKNAAYIGGTVADSGNLVFLHQLDYDGVPRRYLVTAINVEGESDPSQVAETQAYQAPGAPTDLVIDWGDRLLILNWQGPAFDGGTPVTAYQVYRRTEGEDEFQYHVTLPVDLARHVDDNVYNGVEYTYRVTAFNLVGEGEPSGEVSAMPAGPPLPPSWIAAAGMNGSVLVSWGTPDRTGGFPIDGYRLYGISAGMQMELVTEVDPDDTEYLVEGLENGETYLFAVKAVTGVGESALSDIVEAIPVGDPGPPAGLVAVWMGDHVYVTWSAPVDDGGSPVTGYRLRRDEGKWTEVGEMTYLDQDVEWDTSYNYTVYAVTDVGNSPSVRIAFTVPHEPAEPPKDPETSMWPLVAAGLLLAVAAVALLYMNRGREGVEEEEE